MTCEWEIPAVLSSGASTLSAMFDGAAGLVEVTLTTAHGRRQWLASLPDEAWLNLLSTLERSGFPATVGDMNEVEGASHHRTRIARELRDSTESVLLERTASGYDQVNKLMSTLVDQVAPGVLPEVASLPECSETRVEDAFEVLP